MTRPLRLEFAGALFHLTARGDRQESIFLDDRDRRRFLELLGKEIQQQGWLCYAYCLMDNHYHLLIETPQANLVRGMRRLNGVYTQWFNRRRKKSGHVFQGRYKSILVDKDNYLLELCRYIVLNPVRAEMVKAPGEWGWSSYRASVGASVVPKWLAVDEVISLFSGGRSNYRKFVMEGIGQGTVWEGLTGQIYLGGESFLERMQDMADGKPVRGVAKVQRQPRMAKAPEILGRVAQEFGIAVERVLERRHKEAYWLGVYLLRRVGNLTLAEVANRAGVTVARISQIQTKIENGEKSRKMAAVLKHYKLKD